MDKLDEELKAIEVAAKSARRGPNAQRGIEASRPARLERAQKMAQHIPVNSAIVERLQHFAGHESTSILVNRILTQWCDAMEQDQEWSMVLEQFQDQLDVLNRLVRRLEGATDDKDVA